MSYRYSPAALAREPDFEADTLYVVGGLYGNPYALHAVLELADRERTSAMIVFNGDFNWFNVDPESFAAINDEVLRHRALRGNVETELANDSGGADCGCAYPDSVGDAEVARSNEIIVRLRRAGRSVPETRRALQRLPMHMVALVGGARVGLVHGDAESLAGWSYSAEALAHPRGLDKLRADFEAANLDVMASTHTCQAIAACVLAQGRRRALFNNGAAGMPNFRDSVSGLVTRIATRPATGALYGVEVGGVHVDAVPLPYDHEKWLAAFARNWPEGSPAHVSYYQRICAGPDYDAGAAARLLST